MLLRQRRHPLSLLDEMLLLLLLFGIAIGLDLYLTLALFADLWVSVGLPVLVTLVALLLVLAFVRVRRMMTSRYVVTDQRVYKTYGALRFLLLQTTFDKITDLHVRQSPLGRWKDYATVRVETAGSGIPLEGLRDPYAFKRRIEDARSDFVERLVDEHFERVGTEKPKRAPRADVRTLWQGAPSLGSQAMRILYAGLAALVGVVLLGIGAVRAPGMLLFGAGFTLFAGLSFYGAYVQLRHTAYHVTDHGVLVTSGLLTRRRVETTYDKVTDVTTYQDVVGRLLDHGNITVNTAGGSQPPVVFQGLGSPEQVKQVIERARQRHEGDEEDEAVDGPEIDAVDADVDSEWQADWHDPEGR